MTTTITRLEPADAAAAAEALVLAALTGMETALQAHLDSFAVNQAVFGLRLAVAKVRLARDEISPNDDHTQPRLALVREVTLRLPHGAVITLLVDDTGAAS